MIPIGGNVAETRPQTRGWNGIKKPLAKPFDAEEVERIVSVARLHWQDRHGGYIGRTRQRKSADGTYSAT
jgi:hypothetical protein